MATFLEASSLGLGAALSLLALAATALVLGRALTGALDRAVERWVIPAVLGLAGLAHLGFVLGLAGLLRPEVVLAVLAGIHLLGFRVWRGWRAEAAKVRRGRWWRYAWLAAAAFLPWVLLTLYPPTAFDATMYHLPFARGMVASGGVPFLADLRFPVFPQANEMLFALLLLFSPDVAVHGLQWLMTMLTAALVGCWAWDAFARPVAGWLSAAVFLGNPIVVYLSSIGYVEAGLCLFVTAALYALRRWWGSGERRWLVLSAVFAATAADIKYLGLFFVGAIGLAVLFGRRAQPSVGPRARAAGVLLFTGVAAAVLAPWYGRIYAWTGNPLFPFFSQVFGTSPWEPMLFQGFLRPLGAASQAAAEPLELLLSRALDLVRLPWDLVFERDRYNGQPPYSPLFLATLPLAVLAAWKDSRQRWWLALAALYALCCLGLPPDSRYLIPALPLVSLSAAGILTALSDRISGWGRSRLLAAALCAGCFLPGWLYVLYRFHHLGPLPWTREGRESHLAEQLPVYPALAYLNRTLGEDYTVWAFHAENMVYYARGRYLGDWMGPASFGRVTAGLSGPEDLHGRLHRLGASHLLVPARSPGLPFAQDATWQTWFQSVYADSRAHVYRLR